MPGCVRLIFGVHAHQPTGNFDDVFTRALEQAYDPFLDALERHPSIQVVLHYSGCLCEWLESHAARHLDRIAALARSGQAEILTGGFYEPILPLLPDSDRVGQIRMQTRYIKERFGVQARGMWLPERVWEPTLPSTLREAGVDYTLLDDDHFLSSMDGDPVGGYYVTEDGGSVTRLFPISERLRYLIPFREPHETIRYLKSLASTAAESGAEPVAVIVDDAEKFGLWPGTREWVHGPRGGTGWLESFLRDLERNASWLKTSTFESTVREIQPRGRVYLPPGSYFEMGAWALPAGRGRQFEAAVEEAKRRGAWESEKPFLKGGFFRNFLAKYPESLLMVRRAQLLSALLDEDAGEAASDRAGRPSAARRELWRAMCNCSYWHGIFGGLYLPHLRRAVGQHLCRAARLAGERSGPRIESSCRFVDADADGNEEVEIQTPHLGLLVEPARGGALAVIDIKENDFPLGLTLARRLESYHEAVLRPEYRGAAGPEHGSIHEIEAEATEAMRALVVADDRTRASAVDRFLDAGSRVSDLAAGQPVERGDFFSGRYVATLIPSAGSSESIGVVLTRKGKAAGREITVTKTMRAGRDREHLGVQYRLGAGAMDGVSPSRRTASAAGGTITLPGVRFAAEFNLALIETEGKILVVEGRDEGRTISLSNTAEAGGASALRVEEGHSGFSLTFRVEPEAEIWHYPVRTISRSENGYEAIYQGSCLLFLWGEGGALPAEARVQIEVNVPR